MGEKLFEIWMEGYYATGNHEEAHQIKCKGVTLWKGDTFKQACKKALLTSGYDMKYYNSKKNTYYGCRFFNCEKKLENF